MCMHIYLISYVYLLAFNLINNSHVILNALHVSGPARKKPPEPFKWRRKL